MLGLGLRVRVRVRVRVRDRNVGLGKAYQSPENMSGALMKNCERVKTNSVRARH